MVIFSLFRLSGFHLHDLQHYVRQIQTFALSAAAKRNYQSIWNTYLKFCNLCCLPPFPAALATIAAFVTLVSFSVESHHTINNYLSALRRLHVFYHFDTKAFDDIHVRLTEKGLEKSMVRISKVKLHSHHPSCSNSAFVTPLTLPCGLPVWLASSRSFTQQIWFLLHLTPSPHATHFQKQHHIQKFRCPYYHYKNKNFPSR